MTCSHCASMSVRVRELEQLIRDRTAPVSFDDSACVSRFLKISPMAARAVVALIRAKGEPLSQHYLATVMGSGSIAPDKSVSKVMRNAREAISDRGLPGSGLASAYGIGYLIHADLGEKIIALSRGAA